MASISIPAGYLSAVYHVSVPDLAQDGPDNRGALELAHIFHDVVPTHSRQHRIAVALDMIPEE